MASLWQSVKRWLGFDTSPEARLAGQLYLDAVREARRPEWYREGGVPDTLDGRFELILLHLAAFQHRLEQVQDQPFALVVQRALSEAFFRDMDRSLREIGISDTGVGKRIRAMAEAYFGRLKSYRQARAAGDDGTLWREALARNLYGRTFPPRVIPPVLRHVMESGNPDMREPTPPMLDWLSARALDWFAGLERMSDDALLHRGPAAPAPDAPLI